MILSFRDQTTEDLFNGKDLGQVREIPKSIWKYACRKLDMLNTVHELKDLLAPPNNHLERLEGALQGFYSIRIESQYRIIFKVTDGNIKDIQLMKVGD